MQILNHLQMHHQETVKCALRLHNLMGSEKSAVISNRKLTATLNKLEETSASDALVQKYKLAQFAQAHGLLEEESLQLAKDICLELGITEDEFTLANEYKAIEQKHLH